MKKFDEQPMNATERFLYAQIVRQEVIIEQLSSIIEHLAKKDNVAVTSNKTVDKPVEVKEEVKEEVKAPVKRTRKKVE